MTHEVIWNVKRPDVSMHCWFLNEGGQVSATFPRSLVTCSYQRLLRPQQSDACRISGRAGADREREVILATAYETSQKLSGEGDAQAAAIYAYAFGQDQEFYAFTRRLQAYEKILNSGATLVLSPDSELFRYLQNPGGK